MSRVHSCILSLLLALPASALQQNDPWSQSYRFESQRDFVQAALVIKPFLETSEFAQLRCAYLAYLQGRYDESLRGYQRAFEMNAHSLDALLGMTLPLLAQKRWDEAALKANRVLELSTWNYTAALRLMLCEEARGNWNALATLGSELSRRYPSDMSAALYWARGEAKIGRNADAVRAYERVLQLNPGFKEAVDYLNLANPK